MATQTTSSPRVPAWKKLGLKLKFAKETEGVPLSKPSTPSTVDPTTTTHDDGPKDESMFKTHGVKRKRLNGSDSTVAGKQPQQSAEAISQTPTATHKKSKESTTISTDSKPAEDTAPTTTTDDPPAGSKSKKSKPRKIKSTTDYDSTATVRQVPEYVLYVETFHTDKANWKFNKNKQTDLLKNFFSLYRIPAKHDDALISYVLGLQSPHARQRLVDEAESILKALIESQDETPDVDMDSPKARKAAYQAALRKELDLYEKNGVDTTEYHEQQLKEMGDRLAKAKRANAVVLSLLDDNPIPPPSAEPPQRTIGKPAPKHLRFEEPDEGVPLSTASGTAPTAVRAKEAQSSRRTRKSRTAVDSSSESSSSSDSDSSSSDDSDSD